MVCTQCQERAATVHFTLVEWCGAEIAAQDLCESCYANSAAERTRAYHSQPSTPLPADVEHITAEEYLEARAKTTRNGVDIPAFKHIQKELKRLPATQQRLVFEMFPLAWRVLEHGEEPFWEMSLSIYRNAIESHRLPEFITWLEKIIVRCFELRSQLPNPQGDHGRFAVTLSATLISLAKVERARFNAVLVDLKSRCGEANTDARMKLLNGVEEALAQWEQGA